MDSASELRVFISSTFQDLQKEREHLVRRVFPEIRAICRLRGVTFTEIDLRWGLTEEEAARGRIVRTCLEEIDRCRPYFIGILGHRYGWTPEFHEIAMDPELHDRYPWVENAVLEGRSILEMEFIHGMSVPESSEACVYRRRDDLSDCDDPERLHTLIAWIGRQSSCPLREFASPEELGRLVREDLISCIDRHWPDDVVPSALDQDRRANEAFARSRRRAYIPIPEYLVRFRAWVDGDGPPMVITADSGMGKSALLAWLVDSWRRMHPDGFAIEHYVGVSGGSAGHGAILRRVVAEIRERYDIPDDAPDDLMALEESFPTWLARVGAVSSHTDDRLLLAIDALDQLHGTSRLLDWLPSALPANVRLIVSTRPGETLDRMRARSSDELPLRPLQQREREAIVVRYLGEFHKGLSAGLVRRIGADPKGASPLFLRTLAEELRLHGDHEDLNGTVDAYLAVDDLDMLFRRVLERIEEDYSPSVVGAALSAIAVSRSGLTETELLGIAGISRADLSMLLHALDYHLLRNDGRLDFFHNYLRRAVEARYLADETRRRRAHVMLADWFAGQLDLSDDAELDAIDRHALAEMLEALYRGGQHDRLRELLVSPSVLLPSLEGASEYDVLRYWSALETPSALPEIYRRSLSEAHGTGVEAGRRIDLLLKLVRLFRAVGEWDAALERAREAVVLAQELDDATRAGTALDSLGALLVLRGAHAEALDVYHHRRALASTAGDDYAAALADAEIGGIELERGEYDAALQRFRTMRQASMDRGRLDGVARAEGRIGQIHQLCGAFDQAIEHYNEALALFARLGDRRQSAFILGQIGLTAWNRGDADRAMEHYREEARIYGDLGDPHGAAMAIGKIGMVHLDRGQLDQAETCFTTYLAETERLGYARGIGFALGDLGIIELRRGRCAEALDLFDRALRKHRDLDFPVGVALWLQYKAECVANQVDAGLDVSPGQRAAAASWARESAELVERFAMNDPALRPLALIARLESA